MILVLQAMQSLTVWTINTFSQWVAQSVNGFQTGRQGPCKRNLLRAGRDPPGGSGVYPADPLLFHVENECKAVCAFWNINMA